MQGGFAIKYMMKLMKMRDFFGKKKNREKIRVRRIIKTSYPGLQIKKSYLAAACLPNSVFLYLESAVRSTIPKIPQEMISPAPTVSIISGIGRLTE